MDGSEAPRPQTEAEQHCRQHELLVARGVIQQQEELTRTEESLVDDHIDGENPNFAFTRGRTGEPTFGNHEKHGRG